MRTPYFVLFATSLLLLTACSEKSKPDISVYKQQFIHTCMKPIRGTNQMKAQVENFCACSFDAMVKEYGNEAALIDAEKKVATKDLAATQKMESISETASLQCKQHLPQ